MAAQLLKYTTDAYNGVTVDQSLGDDEIQFGKALEGTLHRVIVDCEASVLKWREDGRKAVWIHVPREKAHFLPVILEVTTREIQLSFSLASTTTIVPQRPSC